jgi:hypothetical protein
MKEIQIQPDTIFATESTKSSISISFTTISHRILLRLYYKTGGLYISLDTSVIDVLNPSSLPYRDPFFYVSFWNTHLLCAHGLSASQSCPPILTRNIKETNHISGSSIL